MHDIFLCILSLDTCIVLYYTHKRRCYKLKQNIPDSFVSYIKYYIGKTGISTRELSKRVNKSTNYISSILLGKIQTIEFNTALKIVETLNPQINAVELLIENFGIEPEEFIMKRIQEAEESYERKLEDIKEVEEISENISQNLIEDLLKNGVLDKAQILEKLSKYDFHNSIFYILEIMFYLQEKHEDKYRLLLLIMDELAEITNYKWGEICSFNNEEKKLKTKINKFLQEELINGTTEKEEKIQSTDTSED